MERHLARHHPDLCSKVMEDKSLVQWVDPATLPQMDERREDDQVAEFDREMAPFLGTTGDIVDADALVPVVEYDPARPMVAEYHPTPIAKAVEEDAAVPVTDAAAMEVVEATAVVAAPDETVSVAVPDETTTAVVALDTIVSAVPVVASATQTATMKSGSAATQTASIGVSAATQTEAADFDLHAWLFAKAREDAERAVQDELKLLRHKYETGATRMCQHGHSFPIHKWTVKRVNDGGREVCTTKVRVNCTECPAPRFHRD